MPALWYLPLPGAEAVW